MSEGKQDKSKDEYTRALASATRMLARRQHAAGELRTKLAARFESEPVERALARLDKLGYLDDEKFAYEYARQRFERSPRSALAVIMEIENRGVARITAERAVAELMSDEGHSDETLAERAMHTKLAVLGRIDPDKARKKLFSFLSSRGFSRSVARRVVLDELGLD